LTTDDSLPPYSYVPGRFPHPVTDPAGHSYGQEPHVAPPLDAARWEQSREFCQAVRLFDAGYYWEAHEAWEALWMAAGRTGTDATALKGLIKLAAAGVKARAGNAAGVERHARRAAELLRMAGSELHGNHARLAKSWAGLELEALAQLADRIALAPEQFVDMDSAAVKVVLPPLSSDT
jgi:predicted metal-dependent hydrolase